jgi:predicted nuclease with TOPRIM domain
MRSIFLQQHPELQKATEEKEREAHHARTRVQTLEATNEALTNELEVTKLKLDESEARYNDNSRSQALLDENTALKSKVEQLAMRYDEATAMHLASVDSMGKSEIQDLRTKLAAAETDRDWYVIMDPGAPRCIFWRPKKS